MGIILHFRARSKSIFSFHKTGDLKEPLIGKCNDEKSEKPRGKKTKWSSEEYMFSKKRLGRELIKSLNDKRLENCSYGPIVQSDPFKLQGIIIGPSATPFEGGIFFLSIDVPYSYPYKPPKIKFMTKVFHPNVKSDGTIGIDILGSRWSPAMTIEKVLMSICSFLPDPNHQKDSCNSTCDLYWNNRKVYDKIAREWTLKYAML